MDLALQIIDKPATHNLSYDPAKESRRLRRGDISGVYLATDIGTWDGSYYITNEPITSPRCGFVFVTGVPDRAWEKIQKIIDPEALDGTIIYRRKFRVQVASLPQAVKDKFQLDRHITFTWVQVKNYIRRTYTSALLNDTDIS